MNIQTLHPTPAQAASERLRPTPEAQDNAANAVTGAGEAPGITAVQKTAGTGENGIQGELLDRFAPEEPAAKAGLYRMAKGEDGKPTLRFDGGDKAAEKADGSADKTPAEAAAQEEQEAAEKAEAQKKEAEKAELAETRKTTFNTDRVDREIRDLREDAEDISRQLRTATGEEAEKLEQQLLLTKIELRIKDNDTYRRGHAQVSMA